MPGMSKTDNMLRWGFIKKVPSHPVLRGTFVKVAVGFNKSSADRNFVWVAEHLLRRKTDTVLLCNRCMASSQRSSCSQQSWQAPSWQCRL